RFVRSMERAALGPPFRVLDWVADGDCRHGQAGSGLSDEGRREGPCGCAADGALRVAEGGQGGGRRRGRRSAPRAQAPQRIRPGGAALRRQLEVSNEAAAALTGHGDAILRALEGHVQCEVFVRGNLVTLDGEDEAVSAAATVVEELADLADQGHEIAPGTIRA